MVLFSTYQLPSLLHYICIGHPFLTTWPQLLPDVSVSLPAGTSLKTIVDPHNMLALLLTPQRPPSEDR